MDRNRRRRTVESWRMTVAHLVEDLHTQLLVNYIYYYYKLHQAESDTWHRNNNQSAPYKPFRHLSFEDRSDLNTLILRPGLVESTCRVHLRSVSGHWLFQVYEALSVKINQQNFECLKNASSLCCYKLQEQLIPIKLHKPTIKLIARLRIYNSVSGTIQRIGLTRPSAPAYMTCQIGSLT